MISLKMEKVDLVDCEVVPLEEKQLRAMNGGGWWLPFVAGAIIGGVIYDAWKAGLKYELSGGNGEAMPRGR